MSLSGQGVFDVLVKWDDETQNVVKSNEIVKGESKWRRGNKVSMWWEPEGLYYKGTIVDLEISESESEEDSDEDLVPLSEFKKKRALDDDEEEDIPLNKLLKRNSNNACIVIPSCSSTKCNNKATVECLNQNCCNLICNDHFINESTCAVCEISKDCHEYVVEGVEREEIAAIGSGDTTEAEDTSSTSRRILVKLNRNQGTEYITEKSGKVVQERQIKERCQFLACKNRQLSCKSIDENHRTEIFNQYWKTGELTAQRHWISSHTRVSDCPSARKENSRRSKSVHYFLPNEKGEEVPVCKVMFLNTLAVSEKSVRTVIEKTNESGILENELRGGRVKSLKQRDELIRSCIRSHINKFPRTESHYCRKDTKKEYLNSDLTVTKMFELYKKDQSQYEQCDHSTYLKVFKSQNLAFHKPKKDMCSLCATYFKSSPEGKKQLQESFEIHQAEKSTVRKLKEELKADIDPSKFLATFDLEQVIYLPKTNRCEVFYRRQLANYNFTVYNIKNKMCHSYMWHEGLAKRGSNEISSCLYEFLQHSDRSGASEINLFCDSCSGQNRNTIVPAMMLHFIQVSKSTENLSIHFFEPHHGQNEGDAVHSCVERAINRVSEITMPSELTAIVKCCRSNPTIVREVTTADIRDWKGLSQTIGLLKVREAEDGTVVDWTKVKSLKVKKGFYMQIGFKLSHLDDAYSYLHLDQQRSPKRLYYPGPAYNVRPKLSLPKFQDLLALMDSDLPVISHPDHQTFYKNLPH